MTTFRNEDDLNEWWQRTGEPWFAVQDATTDLYMISQTEDGDAFYVGMPQALTEARDSEVDDNRGWLSAFPGVWPLYLLEVVPEPAKRLTYPLAKIDLGVGDVWAEVTHPTGLVNVTDEDGGTVRLVADEVLGLAGWLREIGVEAPVDYDQIARDLGHLPDDVAPGGAS